MSGFDASSLIVCACVLWLSCQKLLICLHAFSINYNMFCWNCIFNCHIDVVWESFDIDNRVIDGLSNVIDILWVESNHSDSSVFHHVNMMLVDHVQTLGLSKSCVGEHANLVSDVLPASWSIQLLYSCSQFLSDSNDTLSNTSEFRLPLVEQTITVQNFLSNSGSMKRRRWVISTNDHLDLTQTFACSLFISSNDMKTTDSLTIETHVFSIALRNEHWFEFLCKVSDGFNILEDIPTCKSLVCWIEERNEFLSLHDFSYLLPIWGGRVDTSRIMSTCVKQNNVVFLGVLKKRDQIIDSYFLGLGIVVRILLNLEIWSLNDVLMVGPGRGGNQDFDFVTMKLLSDEFEAKAQSSSTRKRLGWANSAIFKKRRIFSKDQLLRSRNKSRNTINGDIFLY